MSYDSFIQNGFIHYVEIGQCPISTRLEYIENRAKDKIRFWILE